MKRTLLISALALVGCGAQQHKSSVFFAPRAAGPALTAEGFQVVGTHDSRLLVSVPEDRQEAFKKAAPTGFTYDKPEFTRYNFNSMEQKLKSLAQQYPNLVTLETYGTSVDGHPEYVLTLTNKGDSSAKPELMITAATHGNERITVDVVLGLVDKLVQGYGKDQRLTDMVNKHIIHWIPAVCVDSYIDDTRANEGVDPNRSYPYPGDDTGHPTSAIQDEVAYFHARDIVGSLDYHAAASMIMFPWAYTYSHIPQADYRKFDDLTTSMAKANGFSHGDIASTIYIAPGSSADYWYWKNHTTAIAVEVSHDFAASGQHYDDIVGENTESTWRFIESF